MLAKHMVFHASIPPFFLTCYFTFLLLVYTAQGNSILRNAASSRGPRSLAQLLAPDITAFKDLTDVSKKLKALKIEHGSIVFFRYTVEREVTPCMAANKGAVFGAPHPAKRSCGHYSAASSPCEPMGSLNWAIAPRQARK